MRKATVTLFDQPAGEVWEDGNGFHFRYLSSHLQLPDAKSVSLTLPLSDKVYSSGAILQVSRKHVETVFEQVGRCPRSNRNFIFE